MARPPPPQTTDANDHSWLLPPPPLLVLKSFFKFSLFAFRSINTSERPLSLIEWKEVRPRATLRRVIFSTWKCYVHSNNMTDPTDVSKLSLSFSITFSGGTNPSATRHNHFQAFILGSVKVTCFFPPATLIFFHVHFTYTQNDDRGQVHCLTPWALLKFKRIGR